MRLILFIDTAASHTQVALASENAVLQNLIHEKPNEQAAQLNVMIASVLEKQQCNMEALAAIAVNAGPGSYTGLRVGLGVAKGICFALDKPILLFDRLALLVAKYKDVIFILKARVGEGFAIVKSNGDTILTAQHIFYDSFAWEDYASLPIVTDDVSLIEKMPEAQLLTAQILDIEVWNEWAQQRCMDNAFDDLAYAEPHYLKSAFTTASKKKIL